MFTGSDFKNDIDMHTPISNKLARTDLPVIPGDAY
jgi:hypothetical protein